jgi:quercetin dioxygenase-like cupin family protein
VPRRYSNSADDLWYGNAMPPQLSKHPVHLGLGATAVSEPEFTGMAWYAEYGSRHAGDGKEGRLVSMHTFEQPWDSWEMHPEGGEVVICTAGEITLVQEIAGEVVRTHLRAGEYAINDPGVWHTADVERTATAVFITAGLGTQIRPRD